MAGFKIDEQTLVITAIVGVGLLFFFTAGPSKAEAARARNDARKEIALKNLGTLQHMYDDLKLGDHEASVPLPKHVREALEVVFKDARALNAIDDIEGLTNENFYDPVWRLVDGARGYLEDFKKDQEEKARHEFAKGGTKAITNVAAHTQVAKIENHFDQRTLNVHHEVGGASFVTHNQELKQLHLHNPHSKTGGPDTVVNASARLTTDDTAFHQGGTTQNQSILDQQQQNTDNMVESDGVESPEGATGQNSAAKRAAKQQQAKNLKVTGESAAVVDTDFKSAPSIPADNKTRPPGDQPVPTQPGQAAAGATVLEVDTSFVEEPSRAVALTVDPQKVLNHVMADIQKLKYAKHYEPTVVAVTRSNIHTLDQVDMRGKIKEEYNAHRANWLREIKSHQADFRVKPFEKHAKRLAGVREFKGIGGGGDAALEREEMGILRGRAAREKKMSAFRGRHWKDALDVHEQEIPEP